MERRQLSPLPKANWLAAEIWPLLSVGVIAFLVLAFSWLAEEVMEGDTAAFDRTLLLAFRADGDPARLIGPPWVQEMGRDVTSLGSYACLGIMFFSVLGYLALVGKRAAAFLVFASVVGGAALSSILKFGFDRPRPDIVEAAARVFTPGFPSGHATLSAVVFLTLGALMTRIEPEPRVKIYLVSVAVLLTLLVGVSRIYLGVHYPTDVLAGWAVGSTWALLCWTVAHRLQSRGTIERPGERRQGGQGPP